MSLHLYKVSVFAASVTCSVLGVVLVHVPQFAQHSPLVPREYAVEYKPDGVYDDLLCAYEQVLYLWELRDIERHARKLARSGVIEDLLGANDGQILTEPFDAFLCAGVYGHAVFVLEL